MTLILLYLVVLVLIAQVLRGYKTSEVDWVLDRLGAEIDNLRSERDAARRDAARRDAAATDDPKWCSRDG